MTLKLYGGARSRASIVRWYLEELQVPYEYILLDMSAGEHRQPEILALNPFSKVPIVVDDGLTLFESGAILLYIREKYDRAPLTLEERSILNQWILFGNSTLATGIFVETSRERETPKLLTPLNAMLGKHPYLLGDQFTVADVAVGSILAYIPIMLKLDLSAYPEVVNYIERIGSRPNFVKTIVNG